jgi:thioredoxin 1
MAQMFNDDNFQKEVLDQKGLVVVDFWAPWCGPCQIMGPIIDQFAEDNKGKVRVGKLNVDESSKMASKYGVSSIPTIIIFKNGEIVDQMLGIQPKEVLEEKINSFS